METPFNRLTPAEAERLAWLLEECSEVIKAGTKILRHGYESFDPTDPEHRGNRYDLTYELADVINAMTLMSVNSDIDDNLLDRLSIEKAENGIPKYMHHQS